MKMFFSLVLFVCFTSSSASAIHFKITGAKQAILLEENVNSNELTSVGDLTVNVFGSFKISYEGDKSGISKILDLGQTIEVVSDTEMKAYGWCFAIDCQIAETMPDQTNVTAQNSLIEWFYAYAHYKDGQWIGQCVRDL